MGYCMIDTLICLSMHDIFIIFVVPHFGRDVIDATLPRNPQVAFSLQTVIAYTQSVEHGLMHHYCTVLRQTTLQLLMHVVQYNICMMLA